ncbi:hypothetical protein RHMOL_Rhmol07G0214800 [Rhododendron molle]|uniref:Uncharacterized protein n=1 Tax=Rhododendron molle TaxID=49168 RepID=A0ACC0N531_RHOML|nr:hypothetical protein RHMOL_Rhmol07G0214800 [Rhododendron molle]
MTDEIIQKYALKGRAPSAFILYNSETIANLKDAGTLITNQTKRDIGEQWKNLSNEHRQKYKDLAKLAKVELAKHKALLPPKSRKKFDPVSRSLTVHGRTFLLTDSHVHECLGINAQGQLIELEGNTSIEFLAVYKNLGMTNGVVQLKELNAYPVPSFCVNDNVEVDSYVHLKMFSTERFFATPSELCSLKPRVWILDTILNLVAVQMTNAERLLYPDKRHFMWYLPVTVSRQILDNPNLNDCDLKKLCSGYFGDTNFTADLSSCSMIYILTNDRGSHWFCIKIDMGIHMAYIFYSKPATRFNSFRKKLTQRVLEGLHRALLLQYGELYQVDVTKFNIANVERQPLQYEEDGYDCGLFIIKFMQGFNYPSGVYRIDDTERPRLLLELCGDKNNRDALEVIKKFEAWKAERGKTGFVYAGGHMIRI